MAIANSSRNSGEKPWVLGISASHNGAFCLLHGEGICVAVQEERLSGLKRARVYGGRRSLGLKYCLETAGITAADLSMIVLSCQRSGQLEENNLNLHPDLAPLATKVPRFFVSHHLAHAASTFVGSGFENAAVLVIDGQGSPVDDLCEASKYTIVNPSEGASEHLSLFHACNNQLTPLEIHVAPRWLEPNPEGHMDHFFSLGGMYSSVATQIFGDPMEAGKVMGLAPYGKPSIPINEFLEFENNRILFPNVVQRRFPYRDRWPEHKLEYQDLAASVQQALETALIRTVARLSQLTEDSCLCLAGGVALNSVANQRIYSESGFEQVYILPSAEDSGVAIGAAYLGLWKLGLGRGPRQFRVDSLGHCSTATELETAIKSVPDIAVHRLADVFYEAAARLSQGEIGGWFQGGSELGPRALGQRSILCSPVGARTKELLNSRVKFRESFRPFAPSVLAEQATTWFDFGDTSTDSPFMLRVVPFRQECRDQVPAVVHVDGTGRLQTLTRDDNGSFYELVCRFYSLTGIPILLNTSMNVRGEPIVETAEDALWCLLGTDLDFCVLHDHIVTKAKSFRSVLDYVPMIIAEQLMLRMPIVDRALSTSIDREDAVTALVKTRWGHTEITIPPHLLTLLSKINGHSTGHQILNSLPGCPRSHAVLHDLLQLRRMRIIRFSNLHDASN
jgi:carbamoyltransferase